MHTQTHTKHKYTRSQHAHTHAHTHARTHKHTRKHTRVYIRAHTHPHADTRHTPMHTRAYPHARSTQAHTTFLIFCLLLMIPHANEFDTFVPVCIVHIDIVVASLVTNEFFLVHIHQSFIYLMPMTQFQRQQRRFQYYVQQNLIMMTGSFALVAKCSQMLHLVRVAALWYDIWYDMCVFYVIEPIPSLFIAAGFLFGSADLAREVPYGLRTSYVYIFLLFCYFVCTIFQIFCLHFFYFHNVSCARIIMMFVLFAIHECISK